MSYVGYDDPYGKYDQSSISSTLRKNFAIG